MPITYRQLQSRVRMLMGEPHPSHPSEPVLWRHLADQAQLLFNQTLNQPVSWAVDSVQFSVDESTDIYAMPAQNFGKDLLIETLDELDPNHVPRPVRRMSLQSSVYGGEASYFGVNQLPGNGEKHSAQTMAIYWEDGNPWLRLYPKPTRQADYRIWYEIAGPATTTDSSNLDIPAAGQAYLTAIVAASVLPLAQWAGLSFDQNSQQRKEFAASLAVTLPQHEKAWRSYIANDRQSGVVIARGFDDRAYSDAW